ncbi:restriction endonuclease fold toxin-2 domain-containing protein [Cellulomonas sp. NPDC055163]
MTTAGRAPVRPAAPPEGWEVARARTAAWWADRPVLAARWARVRAVGLWVSLVLVLVMLLVVESARASVRVYVGSFVLLVVWFLLARTKTLSWATTARLFSLAVLWSAVIGWFTLQVAAALDLGPSSDGSGVALAGFLEETGKLVPLLALALLAPGRVRRFSATDWSLVGFASGIAFNAYEDAVRQVASRGTLWLFWNPPEPYTLNPWTTAGFASTDGVAVAHGHHIWTVTTAMSIGLGIALWRTGRRPARAAGVGLPVLSFVLTVAEHASYNAHNAHSSWPAEDAAGFPAVLSGLWSLTGHGRATGVLSALLLVACLLVDVQRRHRAAGLAPLDGDRLRPGGALVDTPPGQRLLRWWQGRVGTGTGIARRLASLATPVLRALAQWWADVAVVVAAHARVGTEPRRLAVGRARAVAVHVRNIRADAMALTTPGVEPRARRVFQRATAVVGGAWLALALWWGTTMASGIGRYLLLDGNGNYLAGLLENAGQWWNGLSPVQQVAVGAGVAALVALSGGSLALAVGVSGVATYGLSHAEGAATFTRDPVRATADYLATTTPLEAGMDAGELVLTFLPGNVAGAAAGRGARLLGEEIARDPAAFWAAQRAASRGDAGMIDLGAFRRREPIELADGTELAALDETAAAAARARYDALPESHLRSSGPESQYQLRVYGDDERLITLPDGSKVYPDGFTPQYGAIGDAKYVGDPARSFYVPESLGKFGSVAVQSMDKKLSGLAEAAQALGGNGTVELTTNSVQAARFIESRMRALGLHGYVRIVE